jgi:AAA domain, putative AbiEii toxin, Type IV TA system
MKIIQTKNCTSYLISNTVRIQIQWGVHFCYDNRVLIMNTIKLSEARAYKSVANIGTVTVPQLAILAGVNGAGKSHLLQAIKEGAVRAYVDNEIIETKDITLYDWTDFAVKAIPTANAWQIAQRRDQLENAMRNQLKNGKAGQRIKTHSDRLGQRFTETQLLYTPIDELGLTEEFAKAVDEERRAIRGELFSALNPNQTELLESIENITGKLIVEIQKKDFIVAANMVAQKSDHLRLQVSELFLAYRSALDRNDLLRLKATHEGAETEYRTNEEFISVFGPPPWDVLNDLLADLGLDFEVNQPAVAQESYDVSLMQRTSHTEVGFNDLSSGEKVLMALAISLYGSDESRHRIRLPKLMLLDEIDAPLHPDMTRMYFRVIDQLFINQDVGVIMATHNPSTVAIAPEGSVLRMSKTAPRITPVTRQQALAHLTAGVTALTVKFSERRVVLVEGNSDADAYTAVMDALRAHLNAEYGLAFISAGMRAGEGGSKVVRKHVNILRGAGAESIYGLIDRDTGNESSPDGTVLVLGPRGRYTLENYLFDPLLLAALAIRQKFCHQIKGLDELFQETRGTWRGFNRADQDLLQAVADHMLSQTSRAKSTTGEEAMVVTDLVGGQTIRLPRWFVDMPGHRLTEMWLEAIPAFKQFRDETGLRNAIVSFVVADVPQLLSRDFLDVMAALAGHATEE